MTFVRLYCSTGGRVVKVKTKVTDEAPEYHWWTRLPNIVLEKIENPYQLALLFVYKRIAQDAGECWLSTRKIAKMAKMSLGKVSQTRRELEELGLIKVELRRVKGSRGRPCCHVTVIDVWEENEAEWRQIEAERQGRLLPEEVICSPGEQNQGICSPHERYRSPHEHITEKKNNEEDIPLSKDRGNKSPGSKRSRKRDPRLDHPALKIYRSLARLTARHAVRDDLIQLFEEIGEERYKAAIKTWIGRGWNPKNVVGIIDFAKKEAKGGARGRRGISQAQRDYYAAHLDPKD